MSELWNKLHDATLEFVELDWATGHATLRLRTGLPESISIVVVGTGTTELSCPRKFPWGPSVSVNEVRGPTPSQGGICLEIEMQSGDIVLLKAQSIACAPLQSQEQ